MAETVILGQKRPFETCDSDSESSDQNHSECDAGCSEVDSNTMNRSSASKNARKKRRRVAHHEATEETRAREEAVRQVEEDVFGRGVIDNEKIDANKQHVRCAATLASVAVPSYSGETDSFIMAWAKDVVTVCQHLQMSLIQRPDKHLAELHYHCAAYMSRANVLWKTITDNYAIDYQMGDQRMYWTTFSQLFFVWCRLTHLCRLIQSVSFLAAGPEASLKFLTSIEAIDDPAYMCDMNSALLISSRRMFMAEQKRTNKKFPPCIKGEFVVPKTNEVRKQSPIPEACIKRLKKIGTIPYPFYTIGDQVEITRAGHIFHDALQKVPGFASSDYNKTEVTIVPALLALRPCVTFSPAPKSTTTGSNVRSRRKRSKRGDSNNIGTATSGAVTPDSINRRFVTLFPFREVGSYTMRQIYDQLQVFAREWVWLSPDMDEARRFIWALMARIAELCSYSWFDSDNVLDMSDDSGYTSNSVFNGMVNIVGEGSTRSSIDVGDRGGEMNVGSSKQEKQIEFETKNFGSPLRQVGGRFLSEILGLLIELLRPLKFYRERILPHVKRQPPLRQMLTTLLVDLGLAKETWFETFQLGDAEVDTYMRFMDTWLMDEVQRITDDKFIETASDEARFSAIPLGAREVYASKSGGVAESRPLDHLNDCFSRSQLLAMNETLEGISLSRLFEDIWSPRQKLRVTNLVFQSMISQFGASYNFNWRIPARLAYNNHFNDGDRDEFGKLFTLPTDGDGTTVHSLVFYDDNEAALTGAVASTEKTARIIQVMSDSFIVFGQKPLRIYHLPNVQYSPLRVIAIWLLVFGAENKFMRNKERWDGLRNEFEARLSNIIMKLIPAVVIATLEEDELADLEELCGNDFGETRLQKDANYNNGDDFGGGRYASVRSRSSGNPEREVGSLNQINGANGGDDEGPFSDDYRDDGTDVIEPHEFEPSMAMRCGSIAVANTESSVSQGQDPRSQYHALSDASDNFINDDFEEDDEDEGEDEEEEDEISESESEEEEEEENIDAMSEDLESDEEPVDESDLEYSNDSTTDNKDEGKQ